MAIILAELMVHAGSEIIWGVAVAASMRAQYTPPVLCYVFAVFSLFRYCKLTSFAARFVHLAASRRWRHVFCWSAGDGFLAVGRMLTMQTDLLPDTWQHYTVWAS